MKKKLTASELANWQHYLSHEEIEGLKELTRELLHAPVVVKIGAGAGTDSLAMLEERDDLVIFSIDINCCNAEEITNEHLRLPEAGYGDTGHVIRIWGDSRVVGKRWPFPVDMVFVDGGHLEHEKRADIGAWRSKIVDRGIMAFHNYGSPEWPSVKTVIDEMMQDHEQILHVDTLIAFRIRDYNTALSWSMIEAAYEREEAIQ